MIVKKAGSNVKWTILFGTGIYMRQDTTNLLERCRVIQSRYWTSSHDLRDRRKLAWVVHLSIWTNPSQYRFLRPPRLLSLHFSTWSVCASTRQTNTRESMLVVWHWLMQRDLVSVRNTLHPSTVLSFVWIVLLPPRNVSAWRVPPSSLWNWWWGLFSTKISSVSPPSRNVSA